MSAIGCGRNDFWTALTNGQHGFGPVTLCDTAQSPAKIGAEVKDFRLERAPLFSLVTTAVQSCFNTPAGSTRVARSAGA